jgi:hypothetical protein
MENRFNWFRIVYSYAILYISFLLSCLSTLYILQLIQYRKFGLQVNIELISVWLDAAVAQIERCILCRHLRGESEDIHDNP